MTAVATDIRFGRPDFGAVPERGCRDLDRASALDRLNDALRVLDPVTPRVYTVADVTAQPRRRWWALSDSDRERRVSLLLDRVHADVLDEQVAAEQVAAALVHAVVGRVVPAFALTGRAWDPGLENIWVHQDSDVAIDWVGIADVRLRAVGDGTARDLAGARDVRTAWPRREDDVVLFPCVEALAVWTAHRAAGSLLASLDAIRTSMPLVGETFWALVGRAVVAGSAHAASGRVAAGGSSAAVPSRSECLRRGQLLLDAFASAGFPVRGCRSGKANVSFR